MQYGVSGIARTRRWIGECLRYGRINEMGFTTAPVRRIEIPEPAPFTIPAPSPSPERRESDPVSPAVPEPNEPILVPAGPPGRETE